MMYRSPIVPNTFIVPDILVTKNFILRPLTIDDVENDFKAVSEGVDKNGKLNTNRNLTLKQNLIDLGYHQKEFQKRISFTYTVVNPEKNECYGCVYIYPCSEKVFEAEVAFWVTRKAYEIGMQYDLDSAVRKWIKVKWPFKKVFYNVN